MGTEFEHLGETDLDRPELGLTVVRFGSWKQPVLAKPAKPYLPKALSQAATVMFPAARALIRSSQKAGAAFPGKCQRTLGSGSLKSGTADLAGSCLQKARVSQS
jgi:hypothetical protein